MSDRTFICVGTDEGTLLLNLFQITRAHRSEDGLLTIYLSDGSAYNLHGDEASEAIFAQLVDHAMDAKGNSLEYAGEPPEKGAAKVTLIRPEREP